VGKPQGTKPLGRLTRIWEDNIKMDVREIRWGSMDGIDLVQDWDPLSVLVNRVSGLGPVKCSCEQGNEPSGSIKCW
jgi:hypothetical protein